MSVHLFCPYVDFVFKGVFTHSPSALASLICSIQGWPQDTIKSITYLDKELSKDHREGKAGAVDLLVELDDKKRVQVEVQVVHQDFYPERALFYASRLYAQQLSKTESYGVLQPLICIHLLMFNLFADDRPLRCFKLKELETGDVLTNHLEISFLEVKKEFSDNHKRDPKIVDWMKFMKAPNEERMTLQQQEPFKSAYEELERLSKDPAKKWAYESAYKLIKDEESRLKDAGLAGEARGLAQGRTIGLAEGIVQGIAQGKAEGIAEGIAQGKAEGEAEGTKKQRLITISRMLQEGFSVAQIAQLNDLAEEEVKAIASQLPPYAK
jgi:predicted transposase/invertase (TIGR01784 family)